MGRVGLTLVLCAFPPSSAKAPEGILLRDFRCCNPAKRVSAKQDGAQGRNRTTDTVIFSHVLYQLSYLGAEPARERTERRAPRYRGSIPACPQSQIRPSGLVVVVLAAGLRRRAGALVLGYR